MPEKIPGSRRNAPAPRRDSGGDDTRAKLAKEGRLWGMSFVCALAGALTVWLTGSLASGIGAFLLCVVVLGGALMWYEKRRRR